MMYFVPHYGFPHAIQVIFRLLYFHLSLAVTISYYSVFDTEKKKDFVFVGGTRGFELCKLDQVVQAVVILHPLPEVSEGRRLLH